MPYLYCQEHGKKKLLEFKQSPLSSFEGEAVLVFHGRSRNQYLCDSCNATLNEDDDVYLIICLPQELAEALDTEIADHDEYAQEYIKTPIRDVFGVEDVFPDVTVFDKILENSSESREARQFEVKTTGWQYGNLIVGWDPALGTYFAQILDGTADKFGPLLWMRPPGAGIQELDKFEKYINEEVKNKWSDPKKWPPIRLIKLLRINLEKDRLGYWSGNSATRNLAPLQPPSVSSSGIVFTYSPADSTEDSIENLKDWFFDNYEDPAQHTSHNSREGGYLYIHGGPYSAQEELFEYWEDEYPEEIINAASEAIEDKTGISEWAPAYWRIEQEEDYDIGFQPQEQYDQILKRLSELAPLLDKIKPPIGIGHNQSPEGMGELLNSADFAYIENLTIEIKNHGDNPSTVSTNIRNAPSKLLTIRNGLLAVLAVCALGAAKGACEKIGGEIAGHYDIGNKISIIIEKLGEDIEQWLKPSSPAPLPVGNMETI